MRVGTGVMIGLAVLMGVALIPAGYLLLQLGAI